MYVSDDDYYSNLQFCAALKMIWFNELFLSSRMRQYLTAAEENNVILELRMDLYITNVNLTSYGGMERAG